MIAQNLLKFSVCFVSWASITRSTVIKTAETTSNKIAIPFLLCSEALLTIFFMHSLWESRVPMVDLFVWKGVAPL